MAIRIALCSDIDLGFKFKHMTSKKAVIYENHQLEDFEVLISKIVESKVDVVLIAGNLFGTPKPKNKIIEKVFRGFRDLSSRGINVLILPGSHDMPLPFSDDRPVHHIFEDLENVFLLLSEETGVIKSKKVEEPAFEGIIKSEKITIFSPISPFISLNKLDLDLKVSTESTNIFVISDISAFKKDFEIIYVNFLEKLNNFGVNILLVGGVQPTSAKKKKLKFQIVHCPQIHKNNFDYCDEKDGLLISTLQGGKFINTLELNSISKFDVKHEILDVNKLPFDKINDKIYEKIKQFSDSEKGIYKLSLTGKLDKTQYHSIRIFKFQEMGRRFNYYYELVDNIEFQESSPDIQGLNAIKELEQFTQNIIDRIVQEENIKGSEKKNVELIYKSALNLIKQNWDSGGDYR